MKIPVRFVNTDEAIRQIVGAVNTNDDPKSGTVTLTANAVTTTIQDSRIGTDNVIYLMPTTANAAAAVATTYVTSIGKQTATITHANNAQTDRTFKYAIV